jgi:hypothetical protein
VSRSRNTRTLVLLFVGAAIASAALGVIGTLLIKSPAQVAADTAPPRSTVLTAAVTEGTITNTLFLAGTVALGNNIAIVPKPPLNGLDAVITKLPVSIGGQFRAGSVVVEISDRPLIVLSSGIPLIRDLSIGMTGQDVQRFQDALREAGIHVADKAGYFGQYTAAAVKKLYQNAGYVAPTMGGNVLVSRSEIALIPMPGDGQVTTLGAALGSTPTGAVVTVTTLPPVINATVNPADATSLSVGTAVTVRIAGVSTAGVVSLIGVPAQSGGSGFETPVSVTSKTALPPASIGASASLSVNLAKGNKPGLKVPLSAVYSDASGGTSITVVRNGRRVSIPVTIAETGDGYVQIADKAKTLVPGEKVRVGTSG